MHKEKISRWWAEKRKLTINCILSHVKGNNLTVLLETSYALKRQLHFNFWISENVKGSSLATETTN